MEKFMTTTIVLIVVAAILGFAFILRKGFLEMGEEPEEATPGGKKKLKEEVTVTNAPVIYYQLPNSNEKKKVAICYSKTTIGRSQKNDIVIDHSSIEDRHAEIYLAVKGTTRYFNLKNKAKLNPVVLYCPQKEFESTQSFMDHMLKLCKKLFGEKDENPQSDFRIIKGSIPLLEGQNNRFYFGNVKVNIIFEENVYETADSEEIKKEFKYKVMRSCGAFDNKDY